MFIAAIIVARLLGKEVYGEFGIIRSTVNMFLVFAGFGLGLTATKHVAEFKLSDPCRAGRILAISSGFATLTGCIVASIIIYLAPYLATETLKAPHLVNDLRIGAVILLLNSLNGAQTGALSGFEAFRVIAKVNLLAGIFSFPIQILCTYYWGLDGAVWGMALSVAISLVVNNYALKKEAADFNIKYDYKNCLQETNILWKFSLPATLGGLLVGPVSWACDSILVNQDHGFASLGIFNAVVTVSITINAINAVIGSALLPICVTEIKTSNRKFEYVNVILPWLLGIIIILPVIFIHEVPAMLFGKEYAGQAFKNTMFLVMGYTLIIAHRQGIARNFAASGNLWYSFGGNCFWGVMAVVMMYVFKKLGSEGRSLSFLLAYIVNTIVLIPLYIKLKLCDRNLLISRWCNYVWITHVLSFAFLYMTQTSILIRGMFLLTVLVITGICFSRLWSEYCGKEYYCA